MTGREFPLTRIEVIDRLSDIYTRKNADYGNSAHRTFVEFGEVALVIRISDKLSRLERLLQNEAAQVTDESILDTIGDAITYLFMLVADLMTDKPELDEEERMQLTDNIDYTYRLFSMFRSDQPIVPTQETILKGVTYRQYLLWTYRSEGHAHASRYLDLAYCLLEEYIKRSA